MKTNNKCEVEFQCGFVDYDGGATGFNTKIESLTGLIQNGERSFKPTYNFGCKILLDH